MNIIKQSDELTKVEIYRLTREIEREKISEHDCQLIEVDAWILFESENSNGELVETLSIMDKDGIVYTTISNTFIRTFMEIAELDIPDLKIEIASNTSKANRTYYFAKLNY